MGADTERGRPSLFAQNVLLTGPLKAAVNFNPKAAVQAAAPVSAGSQQPVRDFNVGEFVRAVGLQSRPDFNGTVGKLVRFFPEKNRWAVQFDKLAKADPVLIKPECLQGGIQISRVLDLASSEPQFATARGLEWAGRRIRLFGVRGYSSAAGSDEIYFGLQSFRPGVVLMESFDLGDDVAVASGNVLPYRDVFPAEGLSTAMEAVATSEFRAAWSAEAVAVLSALRVDAEVRLCDRFHALSFDRLIHRLSVNDLKHAFIQVTELIGEALETIRDRKRAAGAGQVRLSDLPQNFICPLFPELGVERHRVMGHFARQAAEQGHDVAIVVGAEHLPGIVEQFDQVEDANLSGISCEEILQEHRKLLSEVESCSVPGDAAWNEEIEKRAVVAAFLRSTFAFPADVVLQPVDQLKPDVAEIVKRLFPKFKEAFTRRLMEAMVGPQGAYAPTVPTPQVSGLSQLHELCKS